MKNKKSKFPKKDFAKKPQKFVQREAKEIILEEINPSLVGNTLLLHGVIDRVSQTSGPTLFVLTDGTGTLVLKGFAGAGARAHPEIEEKQAVKTKVKLNEYNGAFEGEIIFIDALSQAETEKFNKKVADTLKKKAAPKDTEFLVKSPILDKLKDSFIKAATEIRLAIMQNRPIIIRHHNDADGYSSGFSLERAILPLIEKQHGFGKAAWEFYTRAPCAAPFYEIDDSIRDTANSLRNAAKFSNKMPLVIIADNGSTEQDLLAIQQGKVHGMEFIVVDHHYFEKDVISPEVLVHISPFLVGEDGAKFSAGMLCTELARFINPVENIEQIPAMAGLADRIDNPEVMNAYLKIAEKRGYSRQLLDDIATVIDFVSAKLRFMEAREYIEVVFGEPRDRQRELVSLLNPYIKNLEAKGLEIAKSTAIIEKLGRVNLQSLSIGDTFPGFGFYPKPGKAIGLLHDFAQKDKKLSSLVTVGLMDTAITIRATDEANFSVHELIELIEKNIPDAFVEGGGHKNAGSINFVPNKQKQVIELLKNYIKKL